MKRVKYTIANWKMNGTQDSYKIVRSIANHINKKTKKSSKVIICPPFTILSDFVRREKNILFGGQDCHFADSGAYTGSISASMLKSAGCRYVIIGHSERRQYNNEKTHEIAKKIDNAIKNKLKVIYCIGEKLSERKNKKNILKKQLLSLSDHVDSKNTIIAYEPVWAIGTGKIPSFKEIDSTHLSIRALLKGIIGSTEGNLTSILYGGSVTSLSAREILRLNNVDGVLVGGASLKPREFCKIIDSY